MANKAGTTTTASTITESGDNALINIPSSGYYDTTSKISVPIETIQNEISLNVITNSDTIVATANCAATSMSFTATVGKIYQIVKYGYQGSQSQTMSINSGAILIHSLVDTTNSGCIIYWVKATSTTVVMNLTTGQNSIAFVAEYNGTDDGKIFKNITTLKRIGVATQTISVPSNNNGYSMLLSLGYQGIQTTSIGSNIITKEGIQILNYTVSGGYGPGFGQLFVKGDISTSYTAYFNHTNHIIFCAY